MILYHGSNIADIKILKPNQADHDRPYVYMTTIDVVAAFYLCNAVEKPYYWFPYGFERDSGVPIYNELYPNALKEVSEGVSGYIYEVEADECQVIPFQNIPCARLATEPVTVKRVVKVENAYDLLNFPGYGKDIYSRVPCEHALQGGAQNTSHIIYYWVMSALNCGLRKVMVGIL